MTSSDALTLVDVIQAVREEAANEHEVVATLVHLISSGHVRLSNEAISAMKALVTPTNAAA